VGTTLSNDEANYLVTAETLISNPRRTLSSEKAASIEKGFPTRPGVAVGMNERPVWRSGKGVTSVGNWVIPAGDDRRLRKPRGFSTHLPEA